MNGFIYKYFDKLIQLLLYTNIVIFFKYMGVKIAKCNWKDSPEEFIPYANFAIDVYQIFKWGILLLFWSLGTTNDFSKYLIYYLIYSNLFIYFYYHVWGSKHNQRTDRATLIESY